MPTKKIDELTENRVIEITDKEKRSLVSYSRFKKLNRPMYYRMMHEIRDDPKQKKTVEEWEKLYNKVKF